MKLTRIGPDPEELAEAIKVADNIGCHWVANLLERVSWQRPKPTSKDLPADFRIVKEPKRLK